MVKISKESLEAFQSTLETIDHSWQTEFNLRETVRQSFGLIKKAKEHRISWEKIAEILKQSSGMVDGISPESIRQYYFEFSKNPELLPQKRRKPSQAKTKTGRRKSDQNESNPQELKSECPDINQPSNGQTSCNNQPIHETVSGLSSPDIEVVSQSTKPELDHQVKEDVRSQFNLNRRGK